MMPENRVNNRNIAISVWPFPARATLPSRLEVPDKSRRAKQKADNQEKGLWRGCSGMNSFMSQFGL